VGELRYPPAAPSALTDKGFPEYDVRGVVASTMAVNTGFRRVMGKSGLRFVRTFFMAWPDKIPGDELGDVEYAIQREQWEAQRSPDGR